MTFRVRSIGLASSARFGCITGAVAAAPLGILLAFLARVVIGAMHRTLQGWRNVSIDAGPLHVPIDVVDLLHLTNVLNLVSTLDRLPVVVIALVCILFLLAAGILVAITMSWWSIAYNAMALLTGGLTVELEPQDGNGRVMVVRGQQRPRR